jgi:hypothetical protein
MPGKPKYLMWINPETREYWWQFSRHSVSSESANILEALAQDGLGEDSILNGAVSGDSVVIAAGEVGSVSILIPVRHVLGRKSTGDIVPLNASDISDLIELARQLVESIAKDGLGEHDSLAGEVLQDKVLIAGGAEGSVGLWLPVGTTIAKGTSGNLKPHTPYEFSQLQPLYEDIQFPLASGRVAVSNAPNWDAFTTNTGAFSFEVDDYIDLQADEIPHKWKEGGTGHVHVHFALATAQATGSDRFVKIVVYVALGKEGSAWTELAVIDGEATIPTGSVDRQAFYLDIDDVDLSSYSIGTQVKCRVKRIAATGGTEFAGEVFITQVGIHVQLDSLGSRQETVK